jgi:hypothetical protein
MSTAALSSGFDDRNATASPPELVMTKPPNSHVCIEATRYSREQAIRVRAVAEASTGASFDVLAQVGG